MIITTDTLDQVMAQTSATAQLTLSERDRLMYLLGVVQGLSKAVERLTQIDPQAPSAIIFAFGDLVETLESLMASVQVEV